MSPALQVGSLPTEPLAVNRDETQALSSESLTTRLPGNSRTGFVFYSTESELTEAMKLKDTYSLEEKL